MSTLPTGTVTFLFTDIEGSTKLWQNHPHKMKEMLKLHDDILRKAIEANSGFIFKTVGDAFCAAFDTAMESLKAALAAQLALGIETWDLPNPILVRMALHTGEAEERDQDYYGPALNRVARLESIGHGGQTLISLVTTELVRDMLPENVELKDLGDRRLKDLTRPESVFQLMHPDLAAEFPPLKSLDQHPHNLPMQPTPLIGREKEMEAVEKMLMDQNVRMVTLTGPGGMGKTRMGLQVAADMIEHFKHGAFFIDLAPLSDPEQVASTITQTLKIKETAGRSLLDSLKDYLSDKHMLLILDNFEQIMKGEGQVVEILSSCTGVRILVTSRESLHIRGEKVFAVPPLTLPKAEHHQYPPIKELTQYESVYLFIERAVAVKQDFHVTNQNAPAVAEICVQLDGIPLAIELAAARITLLPPQAILKRLEHRLRLLTRGAHDLPDRQRTLRSAIDWSYNLLDEVQKKFFATLSVFAGGFSLEASKAICSKDNSDESDVLDSIESLVEKSLLLQEELESGEPRFHMLETIREYGAERLEAFSEAAVLREKHAMYYYKMAEEGEAELEGEAQVALLKSYDREIDNLRYALAWFENTRKDRFLQLTVFLWRFWQIRGLFTEGRAFLSRAIKIDTMAELNWKARALLASGVLARSQGEFDESKSLLCKCLDMNEKVSDEYVEIAALLELGWTYHRMDDLDQAKIIFNRCKDKAENAGDELSYGKTVYGLGCVAWREGRTDEAETYIDEGYRIFLKNKIPRLEALAIANLGLVHYQRKDFEKAKKYFSNAIKIFKAIGEKDQIKICTNNLAYQYQMLEEFDDAILCYEELLDLAEDTGDKINLSVACTGLGEVFLAKKQIEKAFEFGQRAFETVQDCDRGAVFGICCRLLGELWFVKGDLSKSREFFKKSILLLEEAKEKEELERARVEFERTLS